MINTIKQFFEKNIKPASDKPEKVSEHSLQLEASLAKSRIDLLLLRFL